MELVTHIRFYVYRLTTNLVDELGVYKQYLKQDPSITIEEYQGQYLADQKHGLGTLTNADGVYEGDFANDKREGNVCIARPRSIWCSCID